MGLLILIVAIVIISAVVGVIAQFLNKLNEANAPPPQRRAGAGAVRQTDRDMDRFLAEIDRLRKKNAGEAQAEASPPPVARPVRQPERQPERPRPRVVAELAEPKAAPRREKTDAQGFVTRPERREKTDAQGFVTRPERRETTDAQGFVIPPSGAPSPVAPTSYAPAPSPLRTEELPVAAVVAPSSSTGAPATRVTRLPERARPAPKTELARSLTDLLNSGQGVAIAIILQEVLGPPRCMKG